MRTGVFTLITSLSAVAGFVGWSLFQQSALAPLRLDFSGNKLYTVSKGTRTTLEGLGDPITLELVLNQELVQSFPRVRAHASRVQELLRSYSALANGKLLLSPLDPEPFSELEDQVQAAGVRAVDVGEDDPLHFGLIGRNSVGDELVIPYLAPERETMLEYDLTRLIDALNAPDKPELALITDLPSLQAEGEAASYVGREIRRQFDVTLVPRTFAALPRDADILMIAHPLELSPHQLYLIDQFSLRQGRLLILIDPAVRTGRHSDFGSLQQSRSAELGPLAEAWGVRLAPEAVADESLGLPVQVRDADGRVGVERQPLFIAPNVELTDRLDVITADARRPVNWGAPGYWLTEARPGLTLTSLVRTSPMAARIAADLAARDLNPRQALAAAEPTGEALTLAMRLSGTLTTAFPDTVPEPEGGDELVRELERIRAGTPGQRLMASVGRSEIVLIADVDLLDDGFYVNASDDLPVADNASLILNALDNLSGSDALVSLRSRAPAPRPMARIEALRDAARTRLLAEQTELEGQLAQAEASLEALQAKGAASGFFTGNLADELTSEERAEVQRFQAEADDVRARLRSIERAFREDVERVESTIRILNIWLMPILVLVAGFAVWGWQRRRLRPKARSLTHD